MRAAAVFVAFAAAGAEAGKDCMAALLDKCADTTDKALHNDREGCHACIRTNLEYLTATAQGCSLSQMTDFCALAAEHGTEVTVVQPPDVFNCKTIPAAQAIRWKKYCDAPIPKALAMDKECLYTNDGTAVTDVVKSAIEGCESTAGTKKCEKAGCQALYGADDVATACKVGYCFKTATGAKVACDDPLPAGTEKTVNDVFDVDACTKCKQAACQCFAYDIDGYKCHHHHTVKHDDDDHHKHHKHHKDWDSRAVFSTDSTASWALGLCFVVAGIAAVAVAVRRERGAATTSQQYGTMSA